MTNYNNEDLEPHNTVAGVFVDDEGRYLIQDHVKCDMLTFPIGKVKSNQQILDGLKMEMFEELGIDIITATKLFDFEKSYIRESKEVPIHTFIYQIDKYEGIIKNMEPNKCRELKWMTRDELLNSDRKLADCVIEYFY